MGAAKTYFDFPDCRVLNIADYYSAVGKRFTRLYRQYCIPLNFSPLYYIRLGYGSTKVRKRDRWLNKFLSIPADRLNSRYAKLVKILTSVGLIKKIDLRPDLMFSFTKVHNAHHLVQFNDVHISIMESWDHPSKEPYLLLPRRSLTWNKALAEETRRYQNYDTVHTITPLKFRYIFESEKKSEAELASRITDTDLAEDLRLFDNNRLVIYPMCTSSAYFGFAGELEFVKELCKMLRNSAYKLYIRPYPLAPIEDKQKLEALDDKVYVGASISGTDGTEVLDEELQIHKYLIIKKSALIINTGTTFVFDAALCDRPIVQVYFDPESDQDFHITINKQEHLKNYLLNEHAVLYSPQNILTATEAADMSFSRSIKKWLLTR